MRLRFFISSLFIKFSLFLCFFCVWFLIVFLIFLFVYRARNVCESVISEHPASWAAFCLHFDVKFTTVVSSSDWSPEPVIGPVTDIWPWSTFPLALDFGRIGLLRSLVTTRRSVLPSSISFIMVPQSGLFRGVFLYCSSFAVAAFDSSWPIPRTRKWSFLLATNRNKQTKYTSFQLLWLLSSVVNGNYIAGYKLSYCTWHLIGTRTYFWI